MKQPGKFCEKIAEAFFDAIINTALQCVLAKEQIGDRLNPILKVDRIILLLIIKPAKSEYIGYIKNIRNRFDVNLAKAAYGFLAQYLGFNS